MKHLLVLSALFALTFGQFQSGQYQQQLGVTEGPSQIIGVPGPRWQGPLANNAPGHLVGDTPEVAAAKAAHYKAHAEVLAILPPLSPEERYQKTGIPIQQVQPQQPAYHNIPTHIQNNFPGQPIHTSPHFTQFAEEIPRSELGEVPEVAEARKAHLAAYEQVRKILPKLETTPVQRVAPVVPQQQYYNNNQQWNYNQQQTVDTPEVAAAKLEHMRLFQAALG